MPNSGIAFASYPDAEGASMLRVTRTDGPEGACFKLEGKLSGSWVDVVEQSWRRMSSECAGARCAVDLTALTYVDPRGMELLCAMYRSGIDLTASGCMGKGIVKQITTQNETPVRAGR
jgi:ABC-type transporter Mla MlaB component